MLQKEDSEAFRTVSASSERTSRKPVASTSNRFFKGGCIFSVLFFFVGPFLFLLGWSLRRQGRKEGRKECREKERKEGRKEGEKRKQERKEER